ncbi:MAG: threonine--tRNA ligase 1 [Candidatus Parcubacteria bacterium]|nr:MAG: threonine--tRNA ligase 1 [Candidatus Parcubacteria bacterium]
MAENLEKLRHSLAHLLASAVLKIDPRAKLGIGPTTEDGFYYDFLFSIKVDESLLPKLESIMKDLISQNLKFVGKKISFPQAKKIFKNQPFKLELINDLKKYGTTDFQEIQLIKAKKKKAKKLARVTIYQTGDFIDLCRGGHIKSTKEINPQAFKLIRIAGAYWRGDEKNPMLTRIYGVAFKTEKELDEYLKKQEEAEKYNHRVLGEKLKIFLISPYIGKGLPLLLPKGEIIKNILIKYMRKKEEKYGYTYVATPHVASSKLYEKSGHLKYYQNEMYKVIDPAEGEDFYLKPMNCPHHHLIYQELVKSYRDLPLRLAEAGAVYRVEKSGETYGLMRVRGPITQNDAHIYVNEQNLEEEFLKVLDLLSEVYDDLKIIQNYWFRLSLPDFSGKNKEKYGGDLRLWQWASKIINNACQKKKINLVKGLGEAAFYGPKLDMQIKNIYGKEETIATIQVDILVPKRMGLVYVDKNNKEKNPIVIHRAILGSYERFIGFLLEATKGDLPLWLSPIQVLILPVGNEHQDYAEEIKQKISDFRVEIWPAEESLAKRILLAEEEKIPVILVVGEREKKNKTISLRLRHQKDLGEKKIEEIIKLLNEEGDIPN